MEMTIILHGYSGPDSEQCTVRGELTEKGCKWCGGQGKVENPRPSTVWIEEPPFLACDGCNGTGEKLTPLGEVFRDFVARYVNGRLPTS